MICIECGRPITRDAARGGWPRGPVGPVCARAKHIRNHLGAQREAQRVARQSVERRKVVRRKVVQAAVAGETWHDPRQMALELEVAA